MNRNATIKYVATALAVASFGLASSAQAAEFDPAEADVQQNTPAAPVEAPDQAAQPAVEEDQGAVEEQAPEKTQEQLDQDRFDRYCNMKDAEPSHSDKKFCEDFRNSHGMGGGGTTTSSTNQGNTTNGPTQEEKDRYNRYCNMKDAEPSHSDKQFCDWYREHYEHATTSSTGHYEPATPHYEKTKPYYEKTRPVYTKKAAEPSKGSLPFTGLEIWQLGLLGIVLVGGGFGARRLLAS